MSSGQGLVAHERIAMEDHVHDIIKALCKVPAVRDEFGLRRYNHRPAAKATHLKPDQVRNR